MKVCKRSFKKRRKQNKKYLFKRKKTQELNMFQTVPGEESRHAHFGLYFVFCKSFHYDRERSWKGSYNKESHV